MRGRTPSRRGRGLRGAVLACALALALPHAALAQARSPLGRGDVIDRLNSSSMRPLPPLAPPPAARPESVWVPDRYLSLPGVPGPVHVPAHWEHPVSPHEVYAPPLVGRTPDGSPVYFPAGVRPKADARQAP